jgi:hypothetical protein
MEKTNKPGWKFEIGLLAMVAGFGFVAPCLPCFGAGGIPYGRELDASAIVQDRLGVPAENSLILGNGDIIRIFPAWPKNKNAGFTNLRAQGGFLVSAEQVDGKVAKLEITATVGGKLRLLSPWLAIKVNEKALKTDERGIAEMETQPGICMRFKE